jgi:hypothetical protein
MRTDLWVNSFELERDLQIGLYFRRPKPLASPLAL